MNRHNYLVTGAGGDIGFSILKILSSYLPFENLFCSDISKKNYAAIKYDNYFILPKANETDYIGALTKLVEKYNITFIIPTSEAELRFFSDKKIRNIGESQIIMATDNVMEIGFSKYKTAQFLMDSGMSYPWTHEPGVKPLEYPCILKSDTGCGSKQIYVVNDEEEYNFYFKRNPDFIAQEYLEGEEYTCGLYRTKNNEVFSIVFERELMGGITKYGELVIQHEIASFLEELALKLNFHGSINVQLRLTKKGPVVFEVNPRFSSTAIFRDKLGFQDVRWSIDETRNKRITPFVCPQKQVRIFRLFDEAIHYD